MEVFHRQKQLIENKQMRYNKLQGILKIPKNKIYEYIK